MDGGELMVCFGVYGNALIISIEIVFVGLVAFFVFDQFIGIDEVISGLLFGFIL